jgi:hypothetical protein
MSKDNRMKNTVKVLFENFLDDMFAEKREIIEFQLRFKVSTMEFEHKYKVMGLDAGGKVYTTLDENGNPTLATYETDWETY